MGQYPGLSGSLWTIGSVVNITNNTTPIGAEPSIPANHQSGINWLQLCRNPIVDMAIAEPCESLTTPDGYSLTPQGMRVVACFLGAGVLLVYYPTGVTLGEAQGITKKTRISG